MLKPRSALLLALALGLLAVVVSLWIRPVMPPDETRYVQVAREMRATGDYVVPHFGGEPYAHKPPLVFWLMNAAWSLLGSREWVARLVSPLTALLCVGLTSWLARRLWPDRPEAASIAPLVLVSGLAWCGYSTLVMFDAPLTACVLGALAGGVLAARRRSPWPWALVGACLGLGILSKGPITLLHALPPLLLAPSWLDRGRRQGSLGKWYLGLAAAIVLGAAIALAWAIPAARAGGPAFGLDILWRQTAHRMVRAFAHARPPWWYLLVLPVALAPWSLWLSSWRAVAGLRREMDFGLRFTLAWILPALAFLSLVSGKQAHYLLPMLPGACLLLARCLGSAPRARAVDVLPVAGGIAFVGAALLVLRAFARSHAGALPQGMTPAFEHLRALEPALLVALGALVLVVVPRLRERAVAGIAIAGVVGVVLVQASITGWGHADDGPWPPWTEKHGMAPKAPDPRP